MTEQQKTLWRLLRKIKRTPETRARIAAVGDNWPGIGFACCFVGAGDGAMAEVLLGKIKELRAVVVDPFDFEPGLSRVDTAKARKRWRLVSQRLGRDDLASRTTLLRMHTAEAARLLSPGLFDLVFYENDPRLDLTVRVNLFFSLRQLVRQGGVLACGNDVRGGVETIGTETAAEYVARKTRDKLCT